MPYDDGFGGYPHQAPNPYDPYNAYPPNYQPPPYQPRGHGPPANLPPPPIPSHPPLKTPRSSPPRSPRDGRSAWLKREIAKITVKIKNIRNSCAQEKRRKIQNAKATSGENLEKIIDETYDSFVAVKISNTNIEGTPPIPEEEEEVDSVDLELKIMKLNFDLEIEKDKTRRQEEYIKQLENLMEQMKMEKDEERSRLQEELVEITQDLEDKREREIAPQKREKLRYQEEMGMAQSAEENELSPMDEGD